MINNFDFEVYQSYLQLQAECKTIYKELERRYEQCRCPICQKEVILFSLDLLSLNMLVSHMENQISPPISAILQEMQIDHIMTENGKAALTK